MKKLISIALFAGFLVQPGWADVKIFQTSLFSNHLFDHSRINSHVINSIGMRSTLLTMKTGFRNPRSYINRSANSQIGQINVPSKLASKTSTRSGWPFFAALAAAGAVTIASELVLTEAGPASWVTPVGVFVQNISNHKRPWYKLSPMRALAVSGILGAVVGVGLLLALRSGEGAKV